VDISFSFVLPDTGIQPVRFDTEKIKEGKEDVASLDLFFTALTFLDTAALFNTPRVLLDIPSKIPKGLPVGFRGIKDIGCPISASRSERMILNILTNPYWCRWIIYPSGGIIISEIWLLLGSSWFTRRLDLRRVHQCNFEERISFRFPIFEYQKSKITQTGRNRRSSVAWIMSLKWLFLFFPSFEGNRS
jgi:hypothetical protein